MLHRNDGAYVWGYVGLLSAAPGHTKRGFRTDLVRRWSRRGSSTSRPLPGLIDLPPSFFSSSLTCKLQTIAHYTKLNKVLAVFYEALRLYRTLTPSPYTRSFNNSCHLHPCSKWIRYDPPSTRRHDTSNPQRGRRKRRLHDAAHSKRDRRHRRHGRASYVPPPFPPLPLPLLPRPFPSPTPQ